MRGAVQPLVLDIDGEKDIEVLREAMKRLLVENERLSATILKLTKQLLTARGKDKAALERLLAETKAQLARAQKELFGPKTERREGDEETPKDPPKTKPKGHGPTKQPKLRVLDVPHDVDEPDKVCTQCGSPLSEWKNHEEVSEEIDLIAQELVVLRHLQKKWVCSCKGCVETAIGPEKLFPGARYSINVAVEIAVKKYLDHMPLERIARAWGRDGLDVTSQTLWDYLERVGRLVKPVYDQLHAYVFAQPVIGADETRWRLLAPRGHKGSSKTWWVWALTAPTAVVYHLDESRSKEVADKLLRGFHGVVVCDGYGAYKALRAAHSGLVLAHCWAHARREFLDIETAFPIEVAEIVALIKKLYLVEAVIPRGPEGDDERRKVRATSSTQTIGEIFGWVVKTLPQQTPGNGLAKAIGYLAGIWPGLLVFLDDPTVPLDNNASERSMRGPVVGRKNHQGSRSKRGTEVAALMYTILESCKLAGVNPAAYLRAAVLAGMRGEPIALPHEWAPEPPSSASCGCTDAEAHCAHAARGSCSRARAGSEHVAARQGAGDGEDLRFVRTTYGTNGAVKSVGGSYGALITDVRRAADGPIESIGYGDVTGTRTDSSHDQRRRVATVQTYRGPPSGWDNALGTQQLVLQDLTYAYDAVDNPTEIRDWRIASEWPAGAKPVSRVMKYDNRYRVTEVQYRHHGVASGGADTHVSPHEADSAGPADGRRQTPAPEQALPSRRQIERFDYDWLGNLGVHDDDLHAFWDRSGGVMAYSAWQLSYQSTGWSQAGARGGAINEVVYDTAGNQTHFRVHRDGACAGGGSACTNNHYTYLWDEIGQLQEARRDDDDAGAFGARLVYAYDASGDRVRKTALDSAGDALSHTLYIFDSLELRGAAVVAGDYERTARTEVGYLFGHGVRLARLHYEDDAGVAAIAGESLHVLLELPDHLGSTSIVLDKGSGELVEAGSYAAGGGAETDYRPDRWKNFREDYRFTGKEDDLAVGLTYFGKRYLIPALGRWASPDPLAVHSPGSADLNLYAYVHGKLLRATDPTGLEAANPAGTQEDAVARVSGSATKEAPPLEVPGVEVRADGKLYVKGDTESPGFDMGSGPMSNAAEGVLPDSGGSLKAAQERGHRAGTRNAATDAAAGLVMPLVGLGGPLFAAGIQRLGKVPEPGPAFTVQGAQERAAYERGYAGLTMGLGMQAAPVAMATGPLAPRTFQSTDPLVGALANKIEAMHPGHVVGVGVKVVRDGKVVTDLDIVLKNAVLQVKSGGGKGLTTQMAVTSGVTDLPVIGFGPDLGGALLKNIAKSGGLATKDEKLLLQLIKP